TNAPDDQADQEEGRRGKQQQAIGLIPAAIVDHRNDGVTHQLAGTEQLADDTQRNQHGAVTQTVTDTVEERQYRRVLHGEGFRPAHHDAVGDDQADEYRQLLGQRIGIGLENLIDHDHQRGDDHHLHDHADRTGDLAA